MTPVLTPTRRARLRVFSRALPWLLGLGLLSGCAHHHTAAPGAQTVQAPAPQGEVKGSAWQHSAASLRAAVHQGRLVLPPAAAGGAVYVGPWDGAPAATGPRVPLVVFLHGSSGLGLAAIEAWQRSLAQMGVASLAPDSFTLPDRITYKSPVSREVYEQVHALRMAEAVAALDLVRASPRVDPSRIVLAGTSEGATSVARYTGPGVIGRLIYAWSCEDNYFVAQARNHLPPSQPVLNVISVTDPFFSPNNAWLGKPGAQGHCGAALSGHKQSQVVLVPDAPHTLLTLPQTQQATAAFLKSVLGL